MKHFVNESSIVRSIWGKGDTILFIFAGASAEFALNKAVDWLYHTGKLPTDPLGRLFSTVTYARQIIFSDYDTAIAAIDKITAIHKGVEQSRGAQIPDWAYRDVLFMLIDYSISSYQLLERNLTEDEKQEVFRVFYNVGRRMGLTGLPTSYNGYLQMRHNHLMADMLHSDFTTHLYVQYKKHLGFARYQLLKQAQIMVAPQRVIQLLNLGKTKWLTPVVTLYKLTRLANLHNLLKNAILPAQYKAQIMDLDIV